MYEGYPVEAIIKDMGGHVVNMSDARGINPVANTALVNERSLALSDAGGGLLLFRGGFTLADGVIARDNVHLLLDGPDSYLKLCDDAAGPLITGSGVSGFGVIGGRLLGNRENQGGTPGSGSGSTAEPYVLRLVDGCHDIILDTSIEDGLHFGAWIANAGDKWTVSRGGRNCSEGNSGIYYFISSGVRVARRFRFDGIDIDNSMASAGGLKMAAVNGAQFEDIDLGHGAYKIGDYGDTVGLSETLCVEFFSAHGGSFRGIRWSNLHFEGPNDTSTQTWGLSTGGGTVPPDSGDPFPVGAGGVHDVVGGITTTYRCRRQSVEVIGTNIALTTISMRDSAGIPMYPNELYADEGQTNISIGNLVSEGHCNQEAVVSVNAFRGGVNGLTIGRMVVRNSIAPALGFVDTHTVQNFSIGPVIATNHKSWGIAIGSGVTLKNGTFGPVIVDFASEDVTPGADGIIHVGELLEDVHFKDILIDGAPRYAFFGGGDLVRCTLNNFRPKNSGLSDIAIGLDADLGGDWSKELGFTGVNGSDTSPSVHNVNGLQFGAVFSVTIDTLDDGYQGQTVPILVTTNQQTFNFTTGQFRGRITDWTPPAGTLAEFQLDGTFWWLKAPDPAILSDFNTFRLATGFSGSSAGYPIQQWRVDGESDPRVQVTAAGSMTYSGTGSGSGDVTTERLGAGHWGTSNGNIGTNSGAWDGPHLQLGPYHFWVDGSNLLRMKSGAPSSDTDGTIVGTQA